MHARISRLSPGLSDLLPERPAGPAPPSKAPSPAAKSPLNTHREPDHSSQWPSSSRERTKVAAARPAALSSRGWPKARDHGRRARRSHTQAIGRAPRTSGSALTRCCRTSPADQTEQGAERRGSAGRRPGRPPRRSRGWGRRSTLRTGSNPTTPIPTTSEATLAMAERGSAKLVARCEKRPSIDGTRTPVASRGKRRRAGRVENRRLDTHRAGRSPIAAQVLEAESAAAGPGSARGR